MKAGDGSPILLFARKGGPPVTSVKPVANPDDLARAIAALQQAMTAELHRARNHNPAGPPPRRQEEAFSPTDVPRPQWRAGSGLPTDVNRAGRAGAAAGAVAQPAAGAIGQPAAGAIGQPATGAIGQPATGAVGQPAAGAVAQPAAGAIVSPGETRDPLARRILCLHLPRFAMERWLRAAGQRGEAIPDDLPLALAIEGPHGPVVHATNRAAEQAGVHAGARVVDMRALCPTLRVDYADTGADRAALTRLMLWARRWCPWTALDGTAGLVMDTTGSDHLWGGEAAFLREIEGRLAVLGLTAQLAIAPTHGAAWALARFGPHRAICPAETLALQTAPLPVRALRLTAGTVLLLQRLGLKTVGDLAAVPRISLARRFSRAALAENPLLRLDQMMGRLAEPVSSPDDPPRFAVQTNLAEPVQDPTPYLPALCAELCEGLGAAGFGARRVVLTIYRSDGEVASVDVATSQASRDPRHLARLFDGKLDRIDPGFGFDLITLAASVAEKLSTTQSRLDGRPEDGAELAHLVDRLAARFGPRALKRPALHESHVPERREDWVPAMAGRPAPPLPSRTERPIRLFDPPEEVQVIYAVPEGPPAQFVWRRVTHRVTRFAGPERIAPEWWRDRPGTRLRDYYRIEDHRGLRFWIYREGVMEDGRGGVPLWFMHGAFA